MEKVANKKYQSYLYKKRKNRKIEVKKVPKVINEVNEVDEKFNINSEKLEVQEVFTKEELKLYSELTEFLKGKNLILLSKIRLADLVKTKKEIVGKEKTIFFNKTKAKHIDFIITDIQWKIKVLIELDWDSHKKTNVVKSDKFKNKLFENLKIPLERFKNNSIHDLTKLLKYI